MTTGPFTINSVYASGGLELDAWAKACDKDMRRAPGEPDADFRDRVIEAMMRPRYERPLDFGDVPTRRDHDAIVREGRIGHKSRVYPWAAVVLGALAWIVLIAAVMAFKHWVFG